MSEAVSIDVGKLSPHPSARELNQETIEWLTERMADGFDPDYALLVRTVGDGYEIVRGHHRWTAAGNAGLDTVPCIVREMSDWDALVEQVRDNIQSGVTPMDIGRNALAAVERGKPGAGNEGGLSQYARDIGKAKQTVFDLYRAAEVEEKIVRPGVRLSARVLRAIAAAPEDQWQYLADQAAKHEWTGRQTEDAVQRIKQAEREKLEAAERERIEEDEARTFIEANDAELAARVDGTDLLTYREARDLWNRRNREEAERIRREKEAAELERKEIERGRKDTCWSIAECVRKLDGGTAYAEIFLRDAYPHENLIPDGMRLTRERVRSAIQFLTTIESELTR